MDSPPSTPQQPRKGMATRSASNRKRKLPPKHPGGSSRSLMGAMKKATPAKKKATPAKKKAPSATTTQVPMAMMASSSGKRAKLMSSPTAKISSSTKKLSSLSSSPMTQKMGNRKVESMEELKRILHIRETKPNQKTLSLGGKLVRNLQTFTKAPTAHTNLRLSAEYSGYYGPRIIIPPDHPEIDDVVEGIMDEFYHPEDCDVLSVANAAYHLRELIWENYDIDRQTLSEDTLLDYIMVRRNLNTNTTKFVSREEHEELKSFFLHNEDRRMQAEERAEQREQRKEERERRTQEQQIDILGAMTSKLVNHDQQLAHLNSNAVMKDQHQSDMKEMETDILKKVEKKITDSETKLTKKIDEETSKKIQPRSLNFGGPTSPSTSTLSSSLFAGRGFEGAPAPSLSSSNSAAGAPDTRLGGPTASSSSSSSSSNSKSNPKATTGSTFSLKASAQSFSLSSNSAAGPFTFKAPSNSAAGPFTFKAPSNSAAGPFTFKAPSNSAAGPFTFKAPSNSAAGPFTFKAPSNSATGPFTFNAPANSAAGPFTFNAPANSAAGPFTFNAPANSSAGPFTFNAPSTHLGGPTAAGRAFSFQAPGAKLGGQTASSSSPKFSAGGEPSPETQPCTESHDSNITAVDPASLYDQLSQIELPTVQDGSSSNIIVTDDNAPTTSVLPTEDIAFPVRTRPFRLTLPAQAAPSIQGQPSSVQGNAMNLSAQAQPSLFEQFGAPQGWECPQCLLRNVEGSEVCIYCSGN